MAGKHYDLDIDAQLGSTAASDIVIPSQKAVKTYVDAFKTEVEDTYLPSASYTQTVITFRDWSVD